MPEGNGIGLAAHFVFGGYTAHAMQVSVEQGKPIIHRCVCATTNKGGDVGQAVNPLGVEAQMMSATIDGISTTLKLQITIKDGRVEQRNAWRLHEVLLDQFIASFKRAPKKLILDFDATDDPVHGEQDGRFFHGYYRHYCFLPLYVFCGHQLLVSYLRPSTSIQTQLGDFVSKDFGK